MRFDGYLLGAVVQMEARGRSMLGAIPTDLPRDYDALAATLTDRIRASLHNLALLREDAEMALPANAGVRFRSFKREVSTLEHLERFGLAPLSRSLPADNSLNRLIEAIKRETGFPLVAPVVSPFSSSYYVTDPTLRVIAVPLLEGAFVLHLPDLYHELAHFLLAAHDNPKLAPLVDEYVAAGGAVSEHFLVAIHTANDGFTPRAVVAGLETFRSSWIKYWLMEFFCDAFSTACVGPAYAWAHMLLTVKRAHNPFDAPLNRASTHPPDHARMLLMLGILSEHGHTDAVRQIDRLWAEIVAAQGHVRQPEFDLAVPPALLDRVIEHALTGFSALPCNFSRTGTFPPVAGILNQAWEAFLADPPSFPAKEAGFRTRLFTPPAA